MGSRFYIFHSLLVAASGVKASRVCSHRFPTAGENRYPPYLHGVHRKSAFNPESAGNQLKSSAYTLNPASRALRYRINAIN